MLFQEIVNSENFKNRGIIFFLNKTDLFEQKIKVSPLSNIFPTYKGTKFFQRIFRRTFFFAYFFFVFFLAFFLPTFVAGADYDKACAFIKEVFLERIDSSKRPLNSIFTHFTCALDTKNMAFVVKAVRRRLLDEIVAEFV